MNQGQLWNLIAAISPVVLLIGVIVGIIYFKQLNVSYRLVVVYLAICLVTDLFCRFWGYYSHLKYNLFMIPIFGFLELTVFSALYYRYIFQDKSKPLLIFIGTMLLFIFSEIAFASKLLQRESFHSFGKVIADVSIMFYTMRYYWKVFIGKISIHSEYTILNAVVFAYYSINLFIFLSVNFLVNAKLSVVVFFWAVNLISMVLFYLALIYLIWQNGKTRKIMQ